jgi:AcrR family transcriptional regulator
VKNIGYTGRGILGFPETSIMTARRQEAVVFERISPKQVRAHLTRDVIFEATARIIEEGCARTLNTNSIAARAGISIGTLYGHFANKEAILVSMARHQLECDAAAVLEAVGHEAKCDISRTRLAVRALVRLHMTRPEVRRVVMAAHTANDLGRERAALVTRVASKIAANRSLAGRTCLPETVWFVATRAAVGIVRAAFQENSALLGTQEFEDELTYMLDRSFVSAGSGSHISGP